MVFISLFPPVITMPYAVSTDITPPASLYLSSLSLLLPYRGSWCMNDRVGEHT